VAVSPGIYNSFRLNFDSWSSDIILTIMFIFRSEADEYVLNGALNGLFVLGRSVGFIGKYYFDRLTENQASIRTLDAPRLQN